MGTQAAGINVIEDVSQSGGGALAEVPLRTFVVSVMPSAISINELEVRLRARKAACYCKDKGCRIAARCEDGED